MLKPHLWIICISTILLLLLQACSHKEKPDLKGLIPEHIYSNDFSILDDAFRHGYTHNIVYEYPDGDSLATLSIQCTSEGKHRDGADFQPRQDHYSVWTRDLYWGFLGWCQAGDDRVHHLMKSSIQLLIQAKEKNQCLGQSELWPLNDKRFYIPQAYTKGLKSALNLYPWCSESQADFLLLCFHYWNQTGDLDFVASIWKEIKYVCSTLELLDTDGNSLPDALQGSYDYMWIKEDSEEPLMCAKTSLAYQSVASLARELGELDYSDHLSQLARNIKENMNQSIEEGGLWKAQADGGYYVQMRKIGEQDSIHDQFIPYNNLVPMWCGMTSSSQDQAIFNRLDATFEDIYMLDFGPMYCAPAGEHEKSVMDCSSVTWLAFLDIHLRGIKGHQKNRDRIFKLLMKHAGDVDNIPFPEGAGVYGYLTGGAGRSWDNGTFFHMLITGVYGISKHKDGITISDPNPIKEQPLTELKNVIWRDATYDFIWSGKGNQIKNIRMNNKEINAENETYLLHAASGHHRVEIALSE